MIDYLSDVGTLGDAGLILLGGLIGIVPVLLIGLSLRND